MGRHMTWDFDGLAWCVMRCGVTHGFASSGRRRSVPRAMRPGSAIASTGSVRRSSRGRLQEPGYGTTGIVRVIELE